jgi:large subunit ribosomal protein L21
VGTPVVDGARVLAEVLEHGRDKKILVFKYKNKTRYRRRYGHRQDFTRLAIRQI